MIIWIRKAWSSLWFRIAVGVMACIFLLISFLAYSIHNAIDVVSGQVAQARKSMVSIYLEQVDSNLKAAEIFLATNLGVFNSNIEYMQFLNNADKRQLARCELLNEISNHILQYDLYKSIFVWPRYQGDMLQCFSSATTYEQRKGMAAYTQNLLGGDVGEDVIGHWSFHKIQDKDVLLLLYDTDIAFVGLYVDIDDLIAPLQYIVAGQEVEPLIVRNGQVLGNCSQEVDPSVDLNGDFSDYYVSGDQTKYLVVGHNSSVTDYSLAVLTEYHAILDTLPNFQTIGKVLQVLAVFFAFLVWLYLRYALNSPLRELEKAMDEICGGNMDTRLPEKSRDSREFREIRRAFNKMMDCIDELKIGMYEEQISKQKVQLDYLQLQITPHFFLNNLNILYGFSQTKNFEAIQELSVYLTQYLRYFFRSNTELVRLEEEMRHVDTYIGI